MTIAVAQTVFASDATFANSGTTTPATITVAAGSYIHLGWTHESGSGQTVLSVVSSPTLTWTAGNVVNDASNGQANGDYASSVTAAGTYTITVTLTAAALVKGTIAKEITGSSGYDTGSKAGQLQASPTTTANATTTGNTPVLSAQPALISSFSIDNAGNAGPAVGTGFTDGGTGWGFGGTALARAEHKRLTSTAASAATYTAGFNTAHASVAMVFLESGGGGGAVDNPRNFDNGIPGAYYTDPGFSALYGREQQGIPLANRDSGTATIVTGAFSSAGVATPVGVGASIVAGTGSITGTSSVTGVGASTVASVISALGLATITGVPNAISAATITASAVATMLGVGQNAGSIVAGDGSIIGTSSMTGVGASTVAGVVTATGTETTTGIGASTVAGVISELGIGQALGAGASSGGNIIISADGSITASGAANGTGASTVAGTIHASATVTVRGATTNPSHVVHGGHVHRRALRQQILMLERDERDLLELATMLVPLISQGGALWHR